MGTMLEDLVAATVVVIVGGAIVGMVLRLLWGNRGEEKALEEIAAQYKADEPKSGKAKGKKGKK